MQIIKSSGDWNHILDGKFNFFDDIYFRYEYYNLFSKHFGHDLEAVYWEDSRIRVFWPHLIRRLGRLQPFVESEKVDLITPYGYGGPIIVPKAKEGESINRSVRMFMDEYKSHISALGGISELIRFHPFADMWLPLRDTIEITYINDVVVIDLSKEQGSILSDMKKGHRYSIRKSKREDCSVEVLERPCIDDIEIFLNLYYETMDKNDAQRKYYFTASFINDYVRSLDGIIINASYGGEIVGSSIFIYHNGILHYSLSGTKKKLRGIYPSHLILWNAIIWGKENGLECLHLGGGRGRNDNLFEFKSGFSEETRSFHIGKIIFDSKNYKNLMKRNPNSCLESDYFPAYRFGLDDKIV